jgi:hypothetical protein
MTDTLKNWLNSATAWVTANPTDTVYAAAIVAGFAILTTITGSNRR